MLNPTEIVLPVVSNVSDSLGTVAALTAARLAVWTYRTTALARTAFTRYASKAVDPAKAEKAFPALVKKSEEYVKSGRIKIPKNLKEGSGKAGDKG